MKIKKIKMKSPLQDKIFHTICYVVTICWIFALLVPSYWLIISSLKDGTDAFKNPPSFTPTMPTHMYIEFESNDENYTEEDFKKDSVKMLWLICERMKDTNAAKYTIELVENDEVVMSSSMETMVFGNVRYDLFAGDLNESIMDKEKKMSAMIAISERAELFDYKTKAVSKLKTDNRTLALEKFMTDIIDPDNGGYLSDNDRLTIDGLIKSTSYKNMPSSIFNNWINAWTNFEKNGAGFFTFFKNSAFIALMCIVIQWVFNGMTAFGISKIAPKKHVKSLLVFFIIPMMIPGIASTLPMYMMLVNAGMTNNPWGIIVPSVISTTNIILMKGFFDEIANEIYEAADVDGASRLTIFFKIYIPMSLPVFSVIAILTFVGQWNNFFWPFMILKETKAMTFPIIIQELMNASAGQVDFATAMSMSVLVSIPTFIMFGFFQKQMTKGLVFSGLKG